MVIETQVIAMITQLDTTYNSDINWNKKESYVYFSNDIAKGNKLRIYTLSLEVTDNDIINRISIEYTEDNSTITVIGFGFNCIKSNYPIVGLNFDKTFIYDHSPIESVLETFIGNINSYL